MAKACEYDAFPDLLSYPRNLPILQWHNVPVSIDIAKTMTELLKNEFYFSQKGYCTCCDQEVFFVSEKAWLRDNFLCTNCRCIPRERAIMQVIETYYPNWRNLRIHESSPGVGGASLKMKTHAKHYVPSHFFPDRPKGSKVYHFQNEDLEAQTITDESFDLVITQDVFEHLYTPRKAFAEIARTLKSGGAHIFTVPIINKHKPTEVWATMHPDGSPCFLHAPEWHGNPIAQEGSPVTMHYGFDIVDFIRQSSDMETTIEYPFNLYYGIAGEYIEVLVSKKPGTTDGLEVSKK